MSRSVFGLNDYSTLPGGWVFRTYIKTGHSLGVLKSVTQLATTHRLLHS